MRTTIAIPVTETCECGPGHEPIPNMVQIQVCGGFVYVSSLCDECLPHAESDHGDYGTAVLEFVPANTETSVEDEPHWHVVPA